MAERGQRTQIILGSLKAEVSLVKASGDATGARWETARIDADGNVVTDTQAEEMREPLLLGQRAEPDASVVDMTIGTDALDPLGAGETGDDVPSLAPPGMTRSEAEAAGVTEGSAAGVDPSSLIPARAPGAAPMIPQTAGQAVARDERHGIASPTTRMARGITGPDGFVDLTERLAEIDTYVKLDGMIVDAAVPAGAVKRERVRGALFVVPQDPTAQKILALLYDALAESGREIAVRWSKRTNQAEGVLVASRTRGCLMLYEIEWPENERKTPAAAQVGKVVPNLSEAERAAAVDYIERISRPAAALDEVGDERRELQRALIAATKVGRAYVLPERASEEADDLAAAIAAQS